MGRHVAAIMSVAACLMLTCADDKPSQPKQPEETLLTSTSIGTAGGSLQSGGFTLTVPADAFGTTTELTLYESRADHGFGNNVISPLYRIEGLPDTFDNSLQVAITCTGTMSEECFVFVGDMDQDATVELVPASDTGAVMYATIPPRHTLSDDEPIDLLKPAASAATKDYFAAIANFKSTYVTPLFTITYPAYLIDYIDDLDGYIAESKTAIEELGLTFDHDFWTWPGRIIVMEIANWQPGTNGRYYLHYDQPPKVYLDERALTTANLPAMRVALQRMIMGVAQFAYARSNYRDTELTWWHGAVNQWFPSIIPGNTAPAVPDSFPAHAAAPFDGLVAGSTYDTYKAHGYGMASFVRYLEMTHGKNVIGDIYREFAGTDDIYAAIESEVGPDVYNWLPAYFDQLLRGQIYNASTATLAGNLTSTFVIASDSDTLSSSYRGCPYLGAQIYKVDLAYDDIDENAVLDLSVQGSGVNQDYVTVMAYRYKNGTATYLGAGNDVSISDLRTLTQDGYDILAVVVNSYTQSPHTGTTAITLTMRVGTPRTLSFNTAAIRLTDITYDCYEEWEDTTSTFENHHGAQWEVNGEFTENTFYGSEINVSGDYACTLSVSITVDPITMDLISFAASERCGKPSYQQSRSIESVPGMQLPFVGSENYPAWQARGSSSVCDYFSYEGVILGTPPQYEHWYSICTNSACIDEDSQIRIDLYNE